MTAADKSLVLTVLSQVPVGVAYWSIIVTSDNPGIVWSVVGIVIPTGVNYRKYRWPFK